MISKFYKILKQQILLLVCCFSFITYSQGLQLSDQAQISVLTCGPGDELYSIFGHTAIRITDPSIGIDRVYNYGMFDFNTPNFYLKFIKGDLLYSVGQENYYDFLATYKYYNRSINEQFLNLNLDQKQAIYDKIQKQLSSDERYYHYKFIDNNCTTKVVDLLNDVLSTPLDVNFEENVQTQRVILNSFLKKFYFEMLGINLLFSSKVDAENNKLFIPNNLMKSISYSKNNNLNLEESNIIHFKKLESDKTNVLNSIYFLFVLVILFGILLRFAFTRIAFSIFIGILGVFLLFVTILSGHKELIYNDSLFLFNPLYFLLNITNLRRILTKVLMFFILIFFILAPLEKILILLPLIILQIILLVIIYPKKTKSNLWKT